MVRKDLSRREISQAVADTVTLPLGLSPGHVAVRTSLCHPRGCSNLAISIAQTSLNGRPCGQFEPKTVNFPAEMSMAVPHNSCPLSGCSLVLSAGQQRKALPPTFWGGEQLLQVSLNLYHDSSLILSCFCGGPWSSGKKRRLSTAVAVGTCTQSRG